MKLSNLVNKIELLRLELKAHQPLPAERQEVLDKKFRLEFNYNSNHIEGNTLTYGETMLYLIFGKTTGDHDGREYDELRGSDVALKMIREFAADKERPLTETLIKNLNEIILVRPFWADAITNDGQHTRRQITVGDYKKHPNSVRLQNGEMFHYASPQETPARMGDLIQWYKEETEKKELHPVALAALLHYKFVLIHPFDDGNGRISRLLMNYVLYYYDLPPVIIKSANKKEYLSALNKADSGDIDSFVAYIAEQMLWSLELSIKAANGENIEEIDDVYKELSLFKKELHHKNPLNVLPKSAEIIQSLYFNHLSLFIELFEQKISTSFKELFNRWDENGKVNNRSSGPGKRFIDSKMSQEGDSFEPPIYIGDVYSIGLDIYMADFKKRIKNPLSLNLKLEILFNNNDYQINVSTPLGIKSYPEIYNNIITEEKQQEIRNETVRNILKYLQDNTKTSD